MARHHLSRSRTRIILLFALAAAPAGAWADDRVMRSFSLGVGDGAVGIVENGAGRDDAKDRYAGDRGETEGPQAVYAGNTGEVYVLDQVNGRVLRVDPKQPESQTRSLQLPSGVHPTDLVVTQEKLFVWDGGPISLQAQGTEEAPVRSLVPTRDVEPIDESVISAFAQMGSEFVIGAIDPDAGARSISKNKPQPRARQIVASRGKGQVVADVSPTNSSGVQILLHSAKGDLLAKFVMRVHSHIGSVELLDIDQQGKIYVLGENIPVDSNDEPYAFVARYTQNGVLEGVFQIPLDKNVALSRRFVTVSPEGDVYFLRTRKGAVDLLGVGFRPLSSGQVIDLAEHAPPQWRLAATESSNYKGATAAIRPLGRGRVIDTALQFANIRWRVNAGAYGPDPDRSCSGFNRIRRPWYIQGRGNQNVVGIPYCWGCHGTLARIVASISAGRLAGNVCTRDNPRPDVMGVDCSAFVSASWGLSTHFTTIAIPAIAQRLSNPWSLLPGDALNKPGSHVMLFLRFTADRRIEVAEASTGGCGGKVCLNIYPLGALLARGYQPVRYRGLMNDMSSPSLAPPTVAAAAEDKKSVGAHARPRRR